MTEKFHTVNKENDAPTYADIEPVTDVRTVGKGLRDKLPRVTKSAPPEGDSA